MRTNEANVWRRAKVDALIAAHKTGGYEAVESAMMAVRVCGSATSGAGIGFCVNDLRYHVARLHDRADYLESVRARKESQAARLKGAVDRRAEKAERLMSRAARVGGTVSRTEYAKVRDIAIAAQKDAESFKGRQAALTASVADLGSSIEAHISAAASIKALVDVRTTPVMQSDYTQAGVVVASA